MKKITILSNTTYGIDMFLLNTLRTLQETYEVNIITNAESNHYSNFDIKLYSLPLTRKPSFFKDFINQLKIIRILNTINPDLLITLTPKSGLLGSIAGKFCRIKTIHFFTGQVWKNSKGIKRLILKFFDTLIIKLNFRNYCDSFTQRDFLKEQIFLKDIPLYIIGNGSLGGVDINKFNIENKINSKIDNLNLLYLARKTKEKGAIDVLSIFKKLYSIDKNFRLYFIGPEEEILDEEIKTLKNIDNFINVNEHVEILEYLELTDILLMPSRREGFGSIVIQAAAMGIPSVGYDIYGLQDSISIQNGIRTPPNNINAFVNGILKIKSNLKENEKLVRENCRNHALRYDENFFISAFIKEISNII